MIIVKDDRTYATMFTGFDQFGVGASKFLRTDWGIEIDPDIGHYATLNQPDLNLIIEDICRVDYASLDKPYWLQASPVCKNASVANNDGGEAQFDLDLGDAICRAITQLQPEVFSLENVWGYRNFDAFKGIVVCLRSLGYGVDWWHLNAANYGVPQSRKRLILLAHKDETIPRCPQPTHEKPITGNGFGSGLPPWVGWHEAIEDLIPALEESEFADWQIELLPEELRTFMVSDQRKGGKDELTLVDRENSSFTITANLSCKPIRAFIMGAGTFTSSRFENEPMHTITSSGNQLTSIKTFIISGQNASSGIHNLRHQHEPSTTVTASIPEKGTFRAYSNGKVIKLNVRALARLMSIPDWFELPEKGKATVGIGNGFPPLLAEAVVRSVLCLA